MDNVAKTALFTQLGYAPPHDLMEVVLERDGLSRPAKRSIALEKVDRVATLLANAFLPVCARGDCQQEAVEAAGARRIVPASSQADCSMCGGSANRHAVDRMIDACDVAGVTRLCVVGGSPTLRAELVSLVDNRIELRLIDGTTSRTAQLAAADLAWAQRVALWGGTQLDHQVSNLYKGPTVIRFARRSIGALAREVTQSVS